MQCTPAFECALLLSANFSIFTSPFWVVNIKIALCIYVFAYISSRRSLILVYVAYFFLLLNHFFLSTLLRPSLYQAYLSLQFYIPVYLIHCLMESAFLNDGVTQGSLIVLQSTPLD